MNRCPTIQGISKARFWPSKVTQGQMWPGHWTPHIWGFTILFNSNIWPIWDPLRHTRLLNLGDLNMVSLDSIVQYMVVYGFPLMLNSSIWCNSAPLWDISVQNISDLEFELSRSLKVKCHGTTGLPIYGFLLIFNSNLWPNSAPVQDIRFWNVNGLNFYLSRAFMVRYVGAIGIPIYGFLLVVW